jgi:TatD DNase family protein
VGKGRNEPAELARIAGVLAELRGVSLDEIARTTTANAREVLGLPPVTGGDLKPSDGSDLETSPSIPL